MTITEEWSNAPVAILTGEEILVFAEASGFVPPPGMDDSARLQSVPPAALEQRFAEAARVLATKGVLPKVGGTNDSAVGQMLELLCTAPVLVGVSRATGEGRANRQYAVGEGDRIVGHTWDEQGFHLLADLSGRSVDELVRASAGLDAEPSAPTDPEPTVPSFSFSSAALQSAAQEGEAAVARLLSERLGAAGLDPAVGPHLAAAMATGRNSSVGFRTSGPEGRASLTGWLDAGPAGLWSVGFGADADEAVYNQVEPADLAAALIEARLRVAPVAG